MRVNCARQRGWTRATRWGKDHAPKTGSFVAGRALHAKVGAGAGEQERTEGFNAEKVDIECDSHLACTGRHARIVRVEDAALSGRIQYERVSARGLHAKNGGRTFPQIPAGRKVSGEWAAACWGWWW